MLLNMCQTANYTLTVTADKTWINAEERAFPVTVDPTLSQAVQADSMLRSASCENGIRKTVELPELPSSAYITEVKLSLACITDSEEYIGVYGVTSENGDISETLIDFNRITPSAAMSNSGPSEYSWDITDIAKKWYSGDENYGLVFKSASAMTDENDSDFYVSSVNSVTTVSYEYMRGLESYWSYDSQTIGTSSTGYVNCANGALTFNTDLVSTTNSLIPCTLSLVYNSFLNDNYYAYPNAGTANPSGSVYWGFKFNITETLIEVNATSNPNSEFDIYYIYSDADGSQHYFVRDEDTGIYRDLSGLQLKLEYYLNGGNNTMQDIIYPDGTKKTFISVPTPANSLSNVHLVGAWILVGITDIHGNMLEYKLDSSYRPYKIVLRPNGSGINSEIAEIEIKYNSNSGMPYIVRNVNTNEAAILKPDKSDRAYRLSDVIYAVAESNVSESDWNTFYQTGAATGITETRKIKYKYSYYSGASSTRYLDEITDSSVNYSLSYKYTADVKISEITYTNSNNKHKKAISYYSDYTTIQDSGNDGDFNTADDIIRHFVFDTAGRTVTAYSTDKDKKEIFDISGCEYETENQNAVNKYKTSTSTGGISANYLLNGDFDKTGDLLYWTKTGNASSGVQSGFGSGKAILTVNKNSVSSIHQTVNLKSGSYTLSADIDSSELKNAEIWLKAQSLSNSSHLFEERVPINNDYIGTDKYSFAYMSFTVAETEEFKISIELKGSSGLSGSTYVWIDNVMLSKTIGSHPMNIVNNGDFDNTSTSAQTQNFWQITNSSFERQNFAAPFYNALKLHGNISKKVYAQQTLFSSNTFVYVENDIALTVSGFGMATQAINNGNKVFGLRLDVEYGGGNPYKETVYFRFTGNTPIAVDINGCTDASEWQYICGNYIIESGKLIKSIKISCDYSYNSGNAYFDNICVMADSEGAVSRYYYYDNGKPRLTITGKAAVYYKYNDNGNISRIITQDGITEYVYGTSFTDRIESEKFYTYSGRMVFITSGTTPMVLSEGNLGTITEKLIKQYTYGTSCGLVTQIDVKAAGDNNAYIRTSATYNTSLTSHKKHFGSISTSVNSLGETTHYFYDSQGRLYAVMEPNGKGTYYTYDNRNRLTAVYPAMYTAWGAVAKNLGSAQVSYTYNSLGQLATITANGTVYKLSYDNFGNVKTEMIGTATTISVQRNEKNGQIKKVTYSNGVSVDYEYDIIDRVKKITYNKGSVVQCVYEYEYDWNGNLVKMTDSASKRKTVYKYDNTGKIIGFINSDTLANDSVLAGSYNYNDNSTLSGKQYVQKYGTQNMTHTYEYQYNTMGQISLVRAGNIITETIPREYTIQPTYDGFGRVSYRYIKLVNGSSTEVTLSENYTYKSNGNGKTSQIVTYVTGLSTLSKEISAFTYDNNGNIIKITDVRDVVYYQYTYDSLGRLTREDNKDANKTYVYTYDKAGNITSKKTYAFTTGTPGTVQSTNTYTYGNTNWRDQLTKFNGTELTYDAMGNPLTYYNGTRMTFTWIKGRELAKTVKGSTTVTYTYGENGIRITKTVGSTKHKYNYDGSTLISEEYGNVIIVYVYGADGTPIGYRYRTSSYAANTFDDYLYLKNMQGDIIKIYSASGTQVAEYVYDAWGNVISATGTMANVNPLRYRGYYYDADTGLYYLQSRYYDPVTGRFINADDMSNLGADGELNGYNLYAYSGNNPVMYQDDTGESFLATVLTALAVQYVSDVITNLITGAEGIDIFLPRSSIGTYLATGITALIPGNGLTGALVRSFITEGIGVIDGIISGNGEDVNVIDFVKNVASGTVTDLAFGKLTGKIDSIISSKTPKNYSSYAHAARKTNPNLTREQIYRSMQRTIKFSRGISKASSIGLDIVRTVIPI